MVYSTQLPRRRKSERKGRKLPRVFRWFSQAVSFFNGLHRRCDWSKTIGSCVPSLSFLWRNYFSFLAAAVCFTDRIQHLVVGQKINAGKVDLRVDFVSMQCIRSSREYLLYDQERFRIETRREKSSCALSDIFSFFAGRGFAASGSSAPLLHAAATTYCSRTLGVPVLFFAGGFAAFFWTAAAIYSSRLLSQRRGA